MNVFVKYKLYGFLFVIGSLLFLLFFEQSHIPSSRSWQHAWNLGHIPLFIILGYVVFHYFSDINKKKLTIQFLFLITLAVVLGVVIEMMQMLVGRQASFVDVMLDVVGALVGVVLFSQKIRRLNLQRKIIFFALAIIIIIFSSQALTYSLWDEYYSRRNFPLLSDFENASEVDRWTSIEKFEISGDVSVMGEKSLKLNITERKYSGIELQYFPGDWTGYNYLILDVFNPDATAIFLHVSIFDKQHIENNFSFNDRYTKRFHLRTGWNEVRVSLDLIKNSPHMRLMNITRIRGVRLFIVRPNKEQKLYIDGVRLVK